MRIRRAAALLTAGLIAVTAWGVRPAVGDASSALVQGWWDGYYVCTINPAGTPDVTSKNSPGYTNGWVQGCAAGKDSRVDPVPAAQPNLTDEGQVGYISGWYACWKRAPANVPPIGNVSPDWGNGWTHGCADAGLKSRAPTPPKTQPSQGGTGSGGQTGGGLAPAQLQGIFPAAGPAAGGNTVKINGTGLTGATAVRFGDQSAPSLRVVSDAEIDAVAPKGQPDTTEVVTVVTPDGVTLAAATGVYTYQTGPFTAGFAPTTASPGQTVTLSGTAPAAAVLNAYLYCPGGCGTAQFGFEASGGANCSGACVTKPLGPATATPDGTYSLSFPVPAKATPGAASVMVGCDACSAGWTSANGLTIANAATPQPQVDPGFGAGTEDGYWACYGQGHAVPLTNPVKDRFWDYAKGYEEGCREGLAGYAFNTGETTLDTRQNFGSVAFDPRVVGAGSATTLHGELLVRAQTELPGNVGWYPQDWSGTTVSWSLMYSPSGVTGDPATESGATSVTRFDGSDNYFSFPITIPVARGPLLLSLSSRALSMAEELPTTPSVTMVSPARGPVWGGDKITINGWGLDDPQAVSFGDTPAASFSVQSEHQIVAVAPPGAPGTVEVTVTTPYGSSPVSEADGYTYVPGQAPGPIGAVAGALTAGGAVAPGRQVTVSGTGPANATLQTGLFCSGDCDGESLGAVSTDGGGHYTTTFTLPALTKQGTLSPYALAIGCDGCGAGWTGIPLAAATTSSTPPTVAGISPSSGPDTGGQTVTVTGSGLTTDTQAHFGTVAVPVLGATSDGTSLTVTTPPGADGRVDVTVTNGGGTSATSRATAYTYQPPVQPPLPQPPTPPAQPPLSLPPTPTATPVVTGVTPAAGPDTGGQVVTIAGSGFAADAQVTFGPYNTATVAAVSPDGKQITARTPPDLDGPMDVQVATAAGVSPLQRADRYTYQPGPAQAAPSGSPVPGSPSPPGGQACNPAIPAYLQPGCEQPAPSQSPSAGQACNPAIPAYAQPGCKP